MLKKAMAFVAIALALTATSTANSNCESQDRSTSSEGKDIVVEAKEYTKGWEKVRLKAYNDNTRMSIGYGTKSFSGEEITLEEANKRFDEYWKENIGDISKYTNTDGEYIALADTMYNKGGTPKKYTTNGKVDCNKIRKVGNVNKKYYKGIKNRSETNYKICMGELDWNSVDQKPTSGI